MNETDESTEPPSIETVRSLLSDGADDAVASALDAYRDAGPEDRKAAIRVLRRSEDDLGVSPALCPTLVPFLTDDERSVRLATVKLFVTLARTHPDALVEFADALAGRLADEDEFYYVRARAAEALGYLALEHPDVATPERLADLRIGLSFDESEVRVKLAKALAHVALGRPGRLRHHVSALAAHLGTDDELVRYHLCTALVAIGCEHPTALAAAREALYDRLADECPYVRGRAAEALGLYGRSSDEPAAIETTTLSTVVDDEDAFVAARARFALGAVEANPPGEPADERIGSLEAIRDRTDAIVDEMATPDGTECPHCGLTLPDTGPPMCPRCGAPH